ncbi:MAG: hypothetical protein ACI959_000003 [Limisphaerales bacterium]|jgi:hypothetical protein
MNAELLSEILKYTIPALVVFAVTYLTLRMYLQKEIRIKHLEYKMAAMRDAKPVRLQAYERISLLLERIAFNNILHRVRKADMNSRDFQMALLSSIRTEFDHNVTQQVYVSIELWGMVKAAREEVISIINQVAAEIPPNVPSIELSKKIFARLIDDEQRSPTVLAMEKLKEEVMELY